MTQNDTKRNKERFLEALRSRLGNISEACIAAKIGRKTYYRWYSADEKFREDVDTVNERNLDIAETRLLQNINKNDNTAIIFFLKTKGKKRGYVERQEIEHSGEDTSRPTTINIIAPDSKKPVRKKK